MQLNFWPDRAWDTVVGPAWPYLDFSSDADRERVRQALAPYWIRRLGSLRAPILSESAQEFFRNDHLSARPEDEFAGFEFVASAVEGDPAGFWFFELGTAAWAASVRAALEKNPGDKKPLSNVLAVWKTDFAHLEKAALNLIESEPDIAGWGHLLLALSSLWGKRDLDRTIEHLDNALNYLPYEIQLDLFASASLTYALCTALSGDLDAAAELLTEKLQQDEARSFSKAFIAELSYHAGRYFWGAGREKEAIEIVRPVLIDRPAYLLRLVTDPAWGRTALDVVSVTESLGNYIEELRLEMIRWQRTVLPPEKGPDPFASVRVLLELSSDYYPLMAAAVARRKAIEAGAEEPYQPPTSFYTHMRDLREFVVNLPGDLPLRAGEDAPARLHGTKGSHFERIELQLQEAGPSPELVEEVEWLVEILPQAARLAMYEHADRILVSMGVALEVAESLGLSEDELEKYHGWAKRCIAITDRVQKFPSAVGRDLALALADVWKLLEDIAQEWMAHEVRTRGQGTLVVEGEVQNVEPGEWVALRCRVIDASGAPMAGLPVVWRIASGPATPRDASDCLVDCWSVSLHTGLVYLPVWIPEGTPNGAKGVLVAHIYGNRTTVEIPYMVSAS